MPVEIVGDRDGNDVQVSPKFLEEGTGRIELKGRGARISIAEPAQAGNIYCTVEGGARISIGRGCVLGVLAIHALAPGAEIRVGERVGFNGSVSVAAHEASLLDIGDDCLIASECSLNTSDVHHVLDARSGARLNPAADIAVGRHVWLAARVMVLKGARVGADSVVGAGSIVTGQFEPNCLIAGVPARRLRRRITWGG